MTNNLPNPPIRSIELRIEMIDPDNFKMGAKGFIPESQLLDIRLDPREVLFKTLQDMSHKIVTEAFPVATPTSIPDLNSNPSLNLREAQNEAIADMAKNPLIRDYLNNNAIEYKEN